MQRARISASIDPEVDAFLEHHANLLDLSKSALVRKIIDDYFEKKTQTEKEVTIVKETGALTRLPDFMME